ncbi:thioredoxin reductase (NADPH) [Friedmanniella endophytica]|uniref:Thioredoxin reductase (NADPH) n=1 Tax=Microlunatus kandeliicorticis TaxID=1759536 RepID=A0A7W3ISR7_9ACTN|nr:FAD-dependent oxidoreductase [Microlunatus kandeliicorticis]MBA8794574.1 thioredoxin reductase (NADPH) [Microlunatus kandeliicorticis]
MLLTVDDDPSVSRAVARDLRRRYGSEYRVVRADSGPDALDALREIGRRGGRVAVILADYRMPVMNGIDFLEQAMDLFPRARRVLLTAYADTEAAIDAINLVDVDHYLLKPWQPPEEKLYPVIDELIAGWLASPDPAAGETRVVGHHWSSRSYEVRDFLARNQVPYRWFAADEPDGARLLAVAEADPAAIPVVLTPDGRVFTDPDLTELAAAVGLQTTPTAELYDVVIVGAGPAGLGAAVYGASEGLRTMLVERRATGGQAGQSSRIENYLGFPDGISGAQLTDRARRQAVRFGTEIVSAQPVTGLEVTGPTKTLTLGDGSQVQARAVVLATGVAYRQHEATGLAGLVGRGVYYGSAATEAEACAGQHVVVVGGANSAGQAAVFFSRHASRVTLAVRGPDLAASMSSYLIDQIAAIDTIEVRTCTTVVECCGDEHLDSVTLLDANTGESTEVPASHVFVFIGAVPSTEWLPERVVRDPRGFVLTGPDLVHDGRRPAGWALDRDPYVLESSVPGLFVAGDVRAASVKRVASAVGEGALAITLVHEYLARH